jgi:hypothetical protein
VGEGGAWLASEDAQPEDEGACQNGKGKNSASGGVGIHCGDARTRTRLAIAVTSWFFGGLFCVFFAENSQLDSTELKCGYALLSKYFHARMTVFFRILCLHKVNFPETTIYFIAEHRDGYGIA